LNTQTDVTDTLMVGRTDRQKCRHTDTQTCRQIESQEGKHADIQADRQADRQTRREMCRQKERETQSLFFCKMKVMNILEPHVFPAIYELTDLMDSGKAWTLGHVTAAMKDVLVLML
jgi:hypothetical protein